MRNHFKLQKFAAVLTLLCVLSLVPRVHALAITYISDTATHLEFVASGNIIAGEEAHEALLPSSPSGFWAGVYSSHNGFSDGSQVAYWQIAHFATGPSVASGAMTFGAIAGAGETVDIFLDADFDDLTGVSWAGTFTVGRNGDWSYHLRIGSSGVPDSGPGTFGAMTLIGVCAAGFLMRKRISASLSA